MFQSVAVLLLLMSLIVKQIYQKIIAGIVTRQCVKSCPLYNSNLTFYLNLQHYNNRKFVYGYIYIVIQDLEIVSNKAFKLAIHRQGLEGFIAYNFNISFKQSVFRVFC
jgi:hypothetical protein